MELYEHLKNALLKHDVTHFKSWLFRVTYNHCMQILRKEQRLNQKWENYALEVDRLSENWLDDDINDVQESMLNHLEDCIDALKEHQKKCVDLFYLKDKCYQEIADLTGHALKKVKSYIQNGKRNLKNCVELKNGQ